MWDCKCGDGEEDEDDFEEGKVIWPSVLQTPPFEDQLLQSTLWPEVMKLYGHGNEIVSVCCSHRGHLLASSSKGTTADTCVIRLWDTHTWKTVQTLPAHTLTVTQLAFSHHDDVLLSVSRDRQWSIFAEKEGKYVMEKAMPKAHARILWGCSWTHDDSFFATSSRDKTTKVWSKNGYNLSSTINHANPATAVEFAPSFVRGGQYLMAIGDEEGLVELFLGDGKSFVPYQVVSPHPFSHAACVRRVRWCSVKQKQENKEKWMLATCAEDHSVRLYSLLLSIT